MKILAFSDLHFFSAPSELPQYSNRLEYQVKACEWFASLIRKHKPDYVVNLGDSNHQHATISMAALQAFGRGMRSVLDAVLDTNSCNGFYVIAGNHDQATRDGSVTFLDGLLPSHPKLHLVSKAPVELGCGIGLIPHIAEEEQAKAAIASMRGKVEYLFIHQDVKSVLWSPGRPADVGLSLEDVVHSGMTLCGHYHHPQRFDDRRFAVVGSAFYANWSDSVLRRPRGAVLIEDGKLLWAANPHTPLRHTLKVESLRDVQEWISAFLSYAWVRKDDLHRLMLRVKCRTQAVADEVVAWVAASSIELLQLNVVLSVEATEVRVDHASLLDSPDRAVRDYVRQALATDPAFASADALVAVGLEAIKG